MEHKNKNPKIILLIACLVGGFFIWPNFAQAATTDIVFTEIMYDPAGSDTDKEWVEIYNAGTSAVTIVDGSGTDSWRFNDGSNHTLTFVQGSLTIPPGGAAILASNATIFLADHPGYTGTVIDTVMSLNNTSDTIKLSSDKGVNWFGEITYQNTQGGAGDGKSLEKIAGQWQGSSADGGTPGIVTAQTSETSQTPAAPAPAPSTPSPPPAVSAPAAAAPAPALIKINEIFPNPEKDGEPEFIELCNQGNQTTSLAGWKLADTKKVISLPETTLVSRECRAFDGSTTKITLNNSNETIYLYNPAGEAADKLSYASSSKGQSLAWDEAQNKWLWTAKPTPGNSNEINKSNEPPEPRISFSNNPAAPNEAIIISADESSDPDDDLLSYAWSIGPSFQASGLSFTYRFLALGEQLVRLTVSDGQHAVIATSTITVLPANEVIALRGQNVTAKPTSKNSATALAATTAELYITELLPNPAGADDNEWIEIFNPNDFTVSLASWGLDDQDGGSKPYVIPPQNLAPKSYAIFYKKDTKLNLNNADDEVRLFDPTQKLIAGVAYKNAPDNQSFARDDDEDWSWAIKTTPGKANTVSIATNTNTPASSRSSNPPLTPPWEGGESPVDIDLPNIRELDIGTTIRVQGTVAVPPGVLAKTYFYITGSPGIQVYFSQSDWPKLALGDVVGVIGTLAEASGEARLRVTDKQDIVPLYQGKPPTPLPTETGSIGEETEGSLVKISGELVEKKGSNWIIDDGSGPVKITWQTSAKIKKPTVKAGEWIEVVGLVSETGSGYRVLPRYDSDIRLLSATEIADKAGAVLGESATASTSADTIQRFRIPANNQPQTILKYLLITSGGLILLLAGLLIKLRIETKKRN